MPKIDDSNSLEYRRIADTYQCVYFVNKSDNNYYIHNGYGYRTPFRIQGSTLHVDSGDVFCNGNIVTKKLNSVNKLNTNTLSCYSYQVNHCNVHTTNFPFIDVVENKIYGDKHVVTCDNVHNYLDDMRKKILSDVNKITSRVNFMSPHTQPGTNALTYTFEVPEDVRKQCYIVVFATFVVWLHNTATHRLCLQNSDNSGEIEVSSVQHNFTTNEGADRAMQGGSFGSFVYTFTPGTIKTNKFNIIIRSTADLSHGNGFNDIVLLYGE